MSEISKQALKVENSTQFPNNNAGLITPSNLRAFNEDMIDSLVDEITYNEDSASWNNSIDALNTFTASQQPSFTALNEFTASQLTINSGLNSATASLSSSIGVVSSEVDVLQVWSSSVNEIRDDGVLQGYSTRFHFGGNVSASIVPNVGGPIASINIPFSSVDTGSLLLTASFDNGTRDLTFTKGDSSQFSVNIPDASGSILPAGVVSGSSQIILQDTTYTDGVLDQFLTTDGAGNLSFDWVKSLHQNIRNATTSSIVRGTPLYISGSTGDNADVYFADASNSNRRPATLIAYDATLAPGGTGTGIISGEIQGVDTSLYPEGTIVYLGVGGGWSASRPSGSDNLVQALGVITRSSNNGRGVVFNQIGNNLPNIQQGYTWVGDSNGIPQPIATSSFGTPINTGSFATTGSNTFTGTQTISGVENNLILTGSGGEIKIVQIPDYITTFDGGYIQGIDSIRTNALTLSGSSYFQQYASDRASLILNNSNDVYGIGFDVAAGSTNYKYAFRSGSATFSAPLSVQDVITADIFSNPQTLSGSLTIPTDRNAMVVGPVSIDGTLVVEGNSTLMVLSQVSGSGGGSTSPFPYTGDAQIYGSLLVSSSASSSIIVPGGYETVGLLIDGNLNVSDTIYTTSGIRSSGGIYTSTIGGNNFGRLLITSAETRFDTQEGNPMNVQLTGSLFMSSSTASEIIVPNGYTDDGFVINGNLNVKFGSLIVEQAARFTQAYTNNIGRDGAGDMIINSPTIVRPGGPAVAKTDFGVSGSIFVSQSVNIGEVMNLAGHDPLPSGNIGDLAVSGSSLYFYNGTWTLVV